MEDKKKKGIPVALGIASVWFGAHVGPGIASGKQTAVYYSAFGKWGFITPIIAMGLLGILVYYSIEFARLRKITSFKDLTDQLFHPYEKLFSSFFELTFVATVLMVVGGCIATGAEILNQYINLPIAIGTGLLALITILLTMFGANLVRASNTFMTIFILVCLGTIVILGLLSPQGDFSGHWQTSSLSDVPFWSPFIMAIVYTGFQSAGNVANTVSVSEGLTSRKESMKTAVIGIVLNTVLILAIAALLFAYPEAVTETLPNYYIVEKLGIPILLFAYVLLVVLAVLSTTVAFSFSVVARYAKYIPIKDERKRDFTLVLILCILTVIVSLLGLDAIVSKGYKYLGYACIPIVIIPIIAVSKYRIAQATKEKAE